MQRFLEIWSTLTKRVKRIPPRKLQPAVAHQNGQAAEEEEPNVHLHPVPATLQVGGITLFIVEDRLGVGGVAQIFLGRRTWESRQDNSLAHELVALKFEHKESVTCSAEGPPLEWGAYRDLENTYGIPKVTYRIFDEDSGYYVLAMDLLGPSLLDACNDSPDHRMSVQDVACIAVEALTVLKHVHDKGYVHGDVKPENFLLGQPGTPEANRLFLVDLGMATKWQDDAGGHVPYDQRPDTFRGTTRFASRHAHLGRTASRRDDLESLAYTLLCLLNGGIPWQDLEGEDEGFQVCKAKVTSTAEQLFSNHPPAFRRFAEYALDLEFDEEPKYAACIAFFQPLIDGPAQRPIHINAAALKITKVGQKRKREAETEEVEVQEDRHAWKKGRLGCASQEWITVYNKRQDFEQRIHYKVCSASIGGLMEEGSIEGLYVTSVACCQELWILIMDAGTGIQQQVYESTTQFLPKDWVMEKWGEGLFITALAGSASGSLLFMSGGTPYTHQSYKVADAFPYEWISTKWKQGFHVTSLATCQARWAVVMSLGTHFSDQRVELDFQYPSEGIHHRWDRGYRITACAATADQCAFVMSKSEAGSVPAHQITKRTSLFPSSKAIEEAWDKDLYIAGMAYSRTAR